MITNSMHEEGSARVPARLPGELSVEPLTPKRQSRTVKEVESLLAAVQVAMATDLASAKREILDRISGVEDSLETVAREIARKLAEIDRKEADGGQSPG